MVTTIVTTKGQIVIPSKVRHHYGIKQGTQLCIIERDDEIILKPLTREYFQKTAGILQNKKKLTEELLEERVKDKEREESRCKK